MTTAAITPFETIGGTDAVERFVNRFYDLMEHDPAFGELRALHAADLAPMRASLAGFLTGWLGGPRHWFEARPGVCVMSAHADVPVSRETARQWTEAMQRAISDTSIEAAWAERINEAFARMAMGMARG